MKLLLDTHVWLWGLLEPGRLGGDIRKKLENNSNELWLSPVSVWEAILLAERGRIEIDAPPTEWVDRQLARTPMRDAPLTRHVAIKSRTVVLAHEDLADRFLAATASVYELALVTADRRLWKAKGIELLRCR